MAFLWDQDVYELLSSLATLMFVASDGFGADLAQSGDEATGLTTEGWRAISPQAAVVAALLSIAP